MKGSFLRFKVVVITDGKSKDDIKTPGRALKKIAHVMAIGVGVKVRAKDLFELATSDEYVYTPESQGARDSVFLKEICYKYAWDAWRSRMKFVRKFIKNCSIKGKMWL